MGYSGVRLVLAFLSGLPVAAQPRLDLVTTLHGNGNDQVQAMTADTQGNVYLTGSTSSYDLGTAGSYQPERASSAISSVDPTTGKLTPIPLPDGSGIGNVTPDPRHNGTVYVGTYRALLKTTDNGATWTVLSGGLPAGRGSGSVMVAPSNPDVVYASFASPSGITPGSLFRSADGGATWSAGSPIPRGVSLVQGAVDPANPLHIVEAGAQSNDGGVTWTAFPVISYLTFDPTSPGTIYGVMYRGSVPGQQVVKSTDGGATFTAVKLAPFTFFYGILPDANHPGTAYVSGIHSLGATSGPDGIFKSTDAGATWTQVSTATDLALAEDAATGTYYGFGGYDFGAYRSVDGFQTLIPVEAAGRAPYPDLMVVTRPGAVWIVTQEQVSEMFVTKLDAAGSVVFTTYVGGTGGSAGYAIAVDAGGAIYVAGQGHSTDFPATASIQPPTAGATSASYVVKLSGDGTRLVYSTRVSSAGTINGLAVDAAGNIWLAGTATGGYPTTLDAVQPVYGAPYAAPFSEEGIASKIAPDGQTLLYSTYLGYGLDRADAVVLDAAGSAYVAGTRLWKFSTTGTLDWSTDLATEFRAAATDAAGNVYVCGGTLGASVYTSPNAFQTMAPPYYGMILDPRFQQGDEDAFVARYSAAGSLVYATLLGGRFEEACTGMAVDGQGNAIVTGYTYSSDFPARYATQGPFSSPTGFLAKLSADGSNLLYSNFLGDAESFQPAAVARDGSGRIVVAGTAAANEVVLNRILEPAAVPALHVDEVLNAADFYGGAIAPGEWVAIYGGGFGADSMVMLNGQAIPPTFALPGEILARVPDSLSTSGAAALSVASGNATSVPVLLATAAAAAGIFTRDGSGVGQALAFNADGTPNTPATPAAKGENISIAVNGLGEWTPDRTATVTFSCGGAVAATVQNGPVAGLPGTSNTLVTAAVPQASCPIAAPLAIWLVVDGVPYESINSFPDGIVTISVK